MNKETFEYGQKPLQAILDKIEEDHLDIVLLPSGNSCRVIAIESFTPLPQRAGDRGTIRAKITLNGSSSRDVTISWFSFAPRMTQSVLFSARSIGGESLFPQTIGTFHIGEFWYSVKDWAVGEALLDVIEKIANNQDPQETETLCALMYRILEKLKIYMYSSPSLTSDDIPVDFSHEFMTFLEYLCIYEDFNFPAHLLNILREYFTYHTSALYQGLRGTHIHGDLNPGNIIVQGTNETDEIRFVDYKYELTKDWTKDLGKLIITLGTDLGYPDPTPNVEILKGLFSCIVGWGGIYARERNETASWERRLLFFLVRQMVTTSIWCIRMYERVAYSYEREAYLEKSHKLLERACEFTKCANVSDAIALLFKPYLT